MAWSPARARQAAALVRVAPLGLDVIATLRPRSIFGLSRDRAPLPLLLFVAARDGLVVEQDNGGFAVLQRPAGRPAQPGGYGLRLLRWLDHQWSLVVFGGPPASGITLAAVTAPFVVTRVFSIVTLFLSVLWLCVFMTSMLAWQVRWLFRMGAPATPGRGRAAESLTYLHWSVRLVHQPDSALIDELMRLLTERMTCLIRAGLQAQAGDRARIGRPDVTETLVVLTRGISTEQARTAVAQSLRVLPHGPAEQDVIVLASPARLDRAPKRPVAGGSFLVLYLAALGLAVAVCAAFVASAERSACAPASCAGRPATYSSALRFLLQRLLFSDPPGISPATTRVVVLGWLVSVAAVMLALVAFVAARQEIDRNRQANASFDEAMNSAAARARILILVVTPGERQAVLEAVHERVNRPPVMDQAAGRTIYTLGAVAGTEIMLAQAGEQGIGTAAGMLVTAREAIRQCRPDYVILAGICFGLRPGGQQLGDIVVAQRIQDIDHRKVTDKAVRPVILRGVNVNCSPDLLDRFQAGQSTWPGAPVHFGLVLASSTLVNSEALVEQLRRDFPDAIAGEMEGAGAYQAAALEGKPDLIMVKAISDWGHGKTEDMQATAARNAAEFVTHVIATSTLPPRGGTAPLPHHLPRPSR